MQRLLALDVKAAYEGDPAAANQDEVIFCYPGLVAITNYRLAHELRLLGVPIIPRIITEAAHSSTGIDINPGAVIGERFFIDHGTGVVIGETGIIGDRVRLYQGVTLGAKSFQFDDEGNPVRGIDRHPIVEDDVTIYSGATILGRVTIGRGSVIGGNVWLVHSVPPGSRVTQAQSREDDFETGRGDLNLPAGASPDPLCPSSTKIRLLPPNASTGTLKPPICRFALGPSAIASLPTMCCNCSINVGRSFWMMFHRISVHPVDTTSLSFTYESMELITE